MAKFLVQPGKIIADGDAGITSPSGTTKNSNKQLLLHSAQHDIKQDTT